MSDEGLTHFDETGAARMVDVGEKAVTVRTAQAAGGVRMQPETFRRIADRTIENLTAADRAIVRFRRLVIDAAKALTDGVEPPQPWQADAFCTRPGSWFASEDKDFEAVLIERFGHRRGRVPAARTDRTSTD